MKKLFISQPMRGKSDETILAERADAVQAAKDCLGEDVEVLDTFFIFDGKSLEYLGESIKMLAQADIAYFAPGWQEERSCRIENICARGYGIDRIEA